MVKNPRHGNKHRTHKCHLHVGEKGFGGCYKSQFSKFFWQRIFQPQEKNFYEVKRNSKEKCHDHSNLNRTVFYFYEVMAYRYFFSKIYFFNHVYSLWNLRRFKKNSGKPMIHRVPAIFCVCMSYFVNILNCLSNFNKLYNRSFFNRSIISYIILNGGVNY